MPAQPAGPAAPSGAITYSAQAAPCSGSGRRGACAGGLTFAVTLAGRVLALLAVKLALQAGGAGALGCQVILQARDIILQAQDAQGRSQAVPLVEQFP
jgi:hypothetical protein